MNIMLPCIIQMLLNFLIHLLICHLISTDLNLPLRLLSDRMNRIDTDIQNHLMDLRCISQNTLI